MDGNILSTEKQGEEAAAVIERERLVFYKADASWVIAQNQFKPFCDRKPTQGSIDKYYAAECNWKVAIEEVERLALELRGDSC